MIDNNLVTYIKKYSQKNYSINSIKNSLIKQGYPITNITDSINYVKGDKRESSSTSRFKLLLFILVPIAVILILGLIFFLIKFPSKSISEDELIQGSEIQLKENKEAKFIFEEEEHTITIDSVNDDSVTITIQSNPIQVNLKIGEEKKVDLDDDGFYDVQVKLIDIENGVPEIYIKKIHEGTCIENWNCTNWTFSTNLSVSLDFGSEEGYGSYSCVQKRNCTDNNFCNTEDDMPDEIRECPGSNEDYPQQFENCEPANQTTYPFGDIIHYYEEVIGPEGNLCKIKYKYAKHPDPTYQGKEKICTFDTSLGYNQVYQFTDDVCEGELWDIENTPLEQIKRGEGESCLVHACEEHLNCIQNICQVPTNECTDDSDCGACENCEDGQLDCVQVQDSKVCIDCLFDSACKRGYVCNSNDECVPCTNCNCIDELDCGTCNNCLSGNSMCVSTGYTKDCSDCVNDHHCIEGYQCVEYACVIDENPGQGEECGDVICQTDEYCDSYPYVCTPKSALGEECDIYRDSCIDGMCIDDICVSEDFFDQFASCTMGGDDCITPCTNCEDGVYTCPYISRANDAKCVECFMDLQCNSGYKCYLYECVLE